MDIPVRDYAWQHSGDQLFFLIDSRMPEERIIAMVDWLQEHGLPDFREQRCTMAHWSVYFGDNPTLAMRFKLSFG